MQESIAWCVACGCGLTGSQTKYCSQACTNAVRAARAAEWRRQNPDLARARTRESMRKVRERRGPKYYSVAKRKWKYGITPERLDEMLDAQSWKCAICFAAIDQGTAHIDHDHGCCSSVKACADCVRGLLCNRCNAMLGMAQDDPSRLRRAAEYVATHQARPAPARQTLGLAQQSVAS